MQKNPYITLGISEDSSFAEVNDAYNSLKMKYSQERFLEGEAGMEAAKKLADLEVAYSDAIDDLKSKATIESTGTKFGDIADLVKANRLDDAQNELDKIEFRDAEWHYFQSVIYYKKDWVVESKKQLDICVALEPNNPKYQKALEKINQVLTKENPFEAQGNPAPNMDQTRAGYGQPNSNTSAGANACCDTCCLLACCDSCCECGGGDLISCC